MMRNRGRLLSETAQTSTWPISICSALNAFAERGPAPIVGEASSKVCGMPIDHEVRIFLLPCYPRLAWLQVTREVWEARVPVEFVLRDDDLLVNKPKPFYVSPAPLHLLAVSAGDDDV